VVVLCAALLLLVGDHDIQTRFVVVLLLLEDDGSIRVAGDW